MNGDGSKAEDHAGPQRLQGSAVRQLRLQAGLSQEELAARAELEPTLIAGIEAGQVDPTWGDSRRISAALDTSVDKLAALVEELEAGA